jgi:SAM-dependent MidA family methyltransferase
MVDRGMGRRVTPSRSPRRGRADRRGLSFHDFVDDALFHPRWGYYSTGAVRFGTGGHYDTYPLALSPFFGRMVAQYAFRTWRRRRTPGGFEICELGAGNGQLCLDTLLWIHERARHDGAWKAFAERVRYRIVERSAALIQRQRRQLGPLAESVRWSRCDPARRPPRGAPFGAHGLIVANEVLDCLPHHKIVAQTDGTPAVTYVAPDLDGRRLTRAQFAAAMVDPARRDSVRFAEILVPIDGFRDMAALVRRQCPDLGVRPRLVPCFAAPRLEPLMRNTAALYSHADALWIDYGEPRAFHRSAPESKRLFAGPPRSGRRVYDAPGRDDITFLVDFSAARDAARAAGWTIAFLGPQAELGRRTGITLDREAVEQIVRHRALRWMLALAGAGPEQSWQRGAVAWSAAPAAGHVPVRRYVQQSVREFEDQKSLFKLLILRR